MEHFFLHAINILIPSTNPYLLYAFYVSPSQHHACWSLSGRKSKASARLVPIPRPPLLTVRRQSEVWRFHLLATHRPHSHAEHLCVPPSGWPSPQSVCLNRRSLWRATMQSTPSAEPPPCRKRTWMSEQPFAVPSPLRANWSWVAPNALSGGFPFQMAYIFTCSESLERF